MRRLSKILSVILVISLCLTCSYNAEAKEKTLNELQAEAKANRDAYEKAKSQKELSEAERATATEQKNNVETQINETKTQIETTQKEIEKLQEEINKKDEQIKSLMSFVQISNGESNYLEYIFGAKDFTDFIYRVSVAEQLSDYNDKLIKEYNSNVDELDKKKTELTTKQADLEKQQQQLSELEAKLDKEIENISEGMSSKDDEYKTQIGLINSLKSLGCSGGETMSSCKNRIYSSYKSSGSSGGGASANYNGTYMPLLSGRVTSDYGNRSLDYHTGIDFSGTTAVYPVASGVVVHVVDGSTSTCGNHIIYVYHPDYGYTTSYWHLVNRRVSVGQNVTPSTQLGNTGGAGYTDGQYYGGTYVQCAYGGHIHLNLFYGLTTKNSGRINPRTWLKNIPSAGSSFTSYR